MAISTALEEVNFTEHLIIESEFSLGSIDLNLT